MKSKKTLIITSAVILAVIAGLVAFVLTREFDAKGYVSIVLDQTFQGKVEGATEMIDGVTEEELYAQYEAGVTHFVQNNIINGVEVDDETKAKFIDLGKQIFGAMKYEVKEAEEVSKDEYKVAVSYQPSDVFLKYITYVNDASLAIQAKVEKGEYKGTVDEINAQMEAEFLGAAYTTLEQACREMEYGEAVDMEFTVKVGAAELYEIDEAQLHDLMVKIMRLDEIQG